MVEVHRNGAADFCLLYEACDGLAGADSGDRVGPGGVDRPDCGSDIDGIAPQAGFAAGVVLVDDGDDLFRFVEVAGVHVEGVGVERFAQQLGAGDAPMKGTLASVKVGREAWLVGASTQPKMAKRAKRAKTRSSLISLRVLAASRSGS
jgi:hypothetical protein